MWWKSVTLMFLHSLFGDSRWAARVIVIIPGFDRFRCRCGIVWTDGYSAVVELFAIRAWLIGDVCLMGALQLICFGVRVFSVYLGSEFCSLLLCGIYKSVAIFFFLFLVFGLVCADVCDCAKFALCRWFGTWCVRCGLRTWRVRCRSGSCGVEKSIVERLVTVIGVSGDYYGRSRWLDCVWQGYILVFETNRRLWWWFRPYGRYDSWYELISFGKIGFEFRLLHCGDSGAWCDWHTRLIKLMNGQFD